MIESFIGRSGMDDVSFSGGGLVTVSARVARMLGLRRGDVLDVGAEGGECFLYVRWRREETVGRHRGACYPCNKGSHHFRFHSKRLCLRALGMLGRTGRAAVRAGGIADVSGRPAVTLVMRTDKTKMKI